MAAFHAILNNPKLVPYQCYRRDKRYYPLVSLVNNLTGLFLSNNFERMPLFIQRAVFELDEQPPAAGAEAYCNVVELYLAHCAFFVNSFANVSAEQLGYIPDRIANMGSQVEPTAIYAI
jgi:hypothetical protein